MRQQDVKPPSKISLQPLGVNLDVLPWELPESVWSGAENVRFSGGTTLPAQGISEQVFGTLRHDPNWFIMTEAGGYRWWVYASNTQISVTDMTNHHDVTPLFGANADLTTNWTGGVINNLVVLNNGKEPPIWWTGAASDRMTILPGWPAGQTAACIRPYRGYLVALNISDPSGEYPDAVLWSSPAPPGEVPSSWDIADPSEDAGQTELSDTVGAVIDGAQLGDSFIIYKRNSCYIMQYTGSQSIHQFRKLYSGIGVLTTDCIGLLPGSRHLVLTTDDLVVHDGVSDPRSIAQGRAKKWLKYNLNWAAYQTCFIAANYRDNEMWICIPVSNSPVANKAIVWNYVEDSISFRDIPAARYISSGVVDQQAKDDTWDRDSGTWDSDDTVWNIPNTSPLAYGTLVGSGGNFYLVTGVTNSVSRVVRESIPILDSDEVKLITRVSARATSGGPLDLKCRVGGQMYPTQPVSWNKEIAVPPSGRVDTRVKGKFISVEFFSENTTPWVLHSFDIEFEIAESR